MPYDNYQNAFRRNVITEPSQLYSDRDLWTPTATQKFMLGAQFWTNDGRGFRYCKNGAVALTTALMTASEAPNANGLEIVQTGQGAAAGANKFDILLTTGHNYSNNELRDGYLYHNKGTAAALGDYYVIKENIIKTNDTVMTIEVADSTGIRTAIAATDEISVHKSPFRDVVVTPTTAAAFSAVGVPLEAVTANYYFWAQFRGPCTLIVDAGDTVVIGEPIGKPGTNGTAGAGGVVENDGTDVIYGHVMTVGAAAEPSLVYLTLP